MENDSLELAARKSHQYRYRWIIHVFLPFLKANFFTFNLYKPTMMAVNREYLIVNAASNDMRT